MRKNIKVLKALIKMRFERIMMFRLGFFGPFFVDGSLFLVQLLAFDAIYRNVDRIGTWGQGEMIVYIGTFSLLNAVNMVVYFFGVNSIPDKIRSGDLDLYLTKPVSPLFRLTFEQVNPGSIPLVIMSFCIIFYGIRTAGLEPEGRQILAYTFWVLLMIVLYYDLEVVIRSIAFFTMSTARLEQLEGTGIELCMQLPGIAFYGIYKVIFCVILPYGIMATVPVQSLIGELTAGIALHGLLAAAGFSVLAAGLWKLGLRRYDSASS